MQASLSDLQSLTYLDPSVIGDRSVNVMPLWDGVRWHLWLPSATGFVEMQPAGAYTADYVARGFASPNDLIIPFVEFMWQRASWPEVSRQIAAISADFHNLGTSVEKLTHFFNHRQEIGLAVSGFVKTEVEYLFMLSRSIFDLLQESLSWIWNNKISLLDGEAERRRKHRKLPPTFSKVVLSGEVIRDVDELVDTYAIPRTLATAYHAAAPFFASVRRLRDQIVHLGKDVRFVFSTERGFCIPKSAFGFGELPFWRPEHADNSNIVSLLPLLAYVTLNTIEAANQLTAAFGMELTLPPEIAPGYRIFVRGPHNEALIWMLDVEAGGSAWWSDRPAWKRSRIERHAYFLWKDQTGTRWDDPVSNWLEAEHLYRPQG